MASGEFAPMVSLTTSDANFKKVVTEKNADAYLIFDNLDGSVGFQWSHDGSTVHGQIGANRSFTTPSQVPLAKGLWIKRVGGSDVSAARLMLQY